MSGQEILLVFTSLPNRANAERIAEELVTEGMAACVNIMAECTSIYRWQSKIERTNEIQLLIKTTRINYPELESLLRSKHPYEVPEIIAIPVSEGLPEYLNWVTQETQTSRKQQ
jgi:periplasmic divalent cation tolerance protein